jgi:hypothetical protein
VLHLITAVLILTKLPAVEWLLALALTSVVAVVSIFVIGLLFA